MISVKAYISKDLICCGMAYEPLQEREEVARGRLWAAVAAREQAGDRSAVSRRRTGKDGWARADAWVKCIQDSHHRHNLLCSLKARRTTPLSVF